MHLLNGNLKPANELHPAARLRSQIAALTPLPEPPSPFTLGRPPDEEPCHELTGSPPTLRHLWALGAGLPAGSLSGCKVFTGLTRRGPVIARIALTPAALQRLWRECCARQNNLLRAFAENCAPDGAPVVFVALARVRALLAAALGLSIPREHQPAH